MTSKKTKKITKQIPQEREYIVPLRSQFKKVPRYRRTPKAIKTLKQFLAKHMRIPDRDVEKIKLDKYLNQEIWFRGIQNPPHKIKIKAKRQGDIIQVELAELPDKWKYLKLREEKSKQKAEKTKKEKKAEEKTEEKTEEEKEKEKEKEKSTEEAKEKIAETQAKQQKHLVNMQKQQPKHQQRKALQK
jgi:large subunit ribosomal protein L31e